MISSGAKRYPNDAPEGELDPASSQAIILRMVGDGKRVLEIGCASGHISQHLTARGNRVTLVDIDVEALQEASDRRHEAVEADLDERSLTDVLQDRRYDVVLVGSILEHLRDPVRVLRDARTFLSHDGFAIVSAPNVAHGNVRLSLLRGALDDARLGLLDNPHLRHFTLRSLRELCVRAGYRIDAVERMKVPLFFESDLVPRVHEGDFSRDVVAEIRNDREHDTLQFVLRALPVPESEHLTLALDELTAAERRLAETSTKLARLERRSAELEQNQARSAELRALLAEREAELSAARAAAAAAEAPELATERSATVASLEESLAEAESVRAELAARLADVDARAQARERELVQIAEERSSALARLAQEHAAALADARVAAEEAAETLLDARRKEEELAAAVRVAEAERDVLAERLARTGAASSEAPATLLPRTAGESEPLRDAQRDELAARLAELEEGALAREAAVAEAAALREAVAAHELELIELQHRVETERAEFAKQRAEADESIADLRASVAAAATELLDVQHEIELEREALARQQRVAGETLEALKLSSAERDAMAERIIEAEVALARREAEREVLAARLAEAEASVEALWETIAERELELTQDVRALAEERDALAALLVEAEASVETLWNTIEEREQELLGERHALAAERDSLAARLAEAPREGGGHGRDRHETRDRTGARPCRAPGGRRPLQAARGHRRQVGARGVYGNRRQDSRDPAQLGLVRQDAAGSCAAPPARRARARLKNRGASPGIRTSPPPWDRWSGAWRNASRPWNSAASGSCATRSSRCANGWGSRPWARWRPSNWT